MKTSHHGIQLDSIESLRGIAALMILLCHLALIVKLPLPQSLGFVATRFGLGVPLFYTLSGFVLAYGYADRLSDRTAIYSFYIRRLFRIMPLFYLMTALWIVVNWIVWNKTFSASTLLLNLTFLFGLVPGEHESIVWAGWSIGVEMLFYLIFPILSACLPNVRSALIGFSIACVVSAFIQTALKAADFGSRPCKTSATQTGRRNSLNL